MLAKLKSWWWPVAVGLLGLVLAHHETVLTGFAFTQNDLGDTREVNYILEHSWRWLTGDPMHPEYWSPPFYWPAKNAGAYAEVMLGVAPLYWFWRLFGVREDTSLQLWILTLSALNYATCWLMLRRGLKQESLGAAVGAALFAYAGARINQTMHYQLFGQFFTPLCVYALIRLFTPGTAERARMVWLWVAVLSIVGQLWAGIYLGWYLVLGLAVAFAWALVFKPSRQAIVQVVRSHPFTLFAAALVSVALLVPMAVHYFQAGDEVGQRTIEEALSMLPKPKAWLHMGMYSWWYGPLAGHPFFGRIPMEHEQRIGLGFITTVLVLIGFWQLRKPSVPRLFLLTGLSIFFLSTWFGDVPPDLWASVERLFPKPESVRAFTLWRYVHAYFPGAKAIRAVARIVLIELIPASLALSVMLNRLAKQAPPLRFAAFALGAVCVLEQGETTPAFDKYRNRAHVSAIARAVAPECGYFFFSAIDGYDPYWKYQLDAMWASLEVRKPTVNGYAGNSPPGWAMGDVVLSSPVQEQRGRASYESWIRQNRLDPTRACWVKLGMQEGPFGAVFVGQTVPAQMEAGRSYPVSLTLQNVGPRAWQRGPNSRYRLGSQSPRDNYLWGMARVDMPADTPAGGTVTFQFDVTAPSTPGRYPFQWRLLLEGMQWIGELSPQVVVEVTAPATSAPAP